MGQIFVRGHKRAGHNVKAYSRVKYKKGMSRTGRLQKLFGKINRQVEQIKSTMHTGRGSHLVNRLATLRSRRNTLIRIDNAQYK